MHTMLCSLVVTQIITEMLPISSSGHCALLAYVLASQSGIVAMPCWIDALVHGAALLVYMIFFRHVWLWPIKIMCSSGITSASRTRGLRLLARMIALVVLVDSITVCGYVLVHRPMIKNVLAHPMFLAAGFLATGCCLFSLRWIEKRKQPFDSVFDLRSALILGCVQACALLPGVSRFASTYVATRALGFSVRRGFQTCFLMFVPLIVASLVRELGHVDHQVVAVQIDTLFCACAALVVGAIICSYVVLFLMYALARSGRLWWLGWYMLVPFTGALVVCCMR